MTGAGIDGTTLYVLGNIYGSSTEYSVHKYNATAGTSIAQYMNQYDFPGLQPSVYDIAYSSAGVWVARDQADSPILCYNTNGVLVDYVMGTTVPAAAGLTIDPDGFLWVSDPENDKIYKVATTTSISEANAECFTQGSLIPAANPFQQFAVINAAGYPDGSSVDIYDIRGRLVHTGSVTGELFSWNASSNPAGAYMIRFSNSSEFATIRLMKTGD